MGNEARTVAVVGAGTAGSAAALLLARAGHSVTLFEAVADPQPVGAGLMLQPTGLAVLAQLGLLEEILDHGAFVSRLRAVTTNGRTVLDLKYERLRSSAFGVGIHRGVLFDALFGAAKSTDGIDVHSGVRIDALRRVGDQTDLFAGEAHHGAFDLVVVADGARSSLRDDSGLTTRSSEYPWGALWAIVPDSENDFHSELHQVLHGTQVMLGFLPTGRGPSTTAEDPALVSVFWSIRADRVDAWRADGFEAWRERVVGIEPRAEALLAQLDSCDDLLFARYRDVVMAPWHDTSRRAVFIGDAAHATSPQLGQGANLALCDAAGLALALADTSTVEEALDNYSASRASHLRYYQWAARILTPFFQSDLEPLAWLRDAFMGTACRLPFVRTKMVRTMCGVERGIVFGRPLELPRIPRPSPPPTYELIDEGEVLYAILGEATVTGIYKVYRTESSFGDDTSRVWEWFIDGEELTVEDNPYTLPMDNIMLNQHTDEGGPLVNFERTSPTTWTAAVSTYYSHHLGSVTTNYDVTIDTASRTANLASESDVWVD